MGWGRNAPDPQMCSAGACNPPSTSGHSGAVEAREGYEPKAARDGCPQQGQSGDAQHSSGPSTIREKGPAAALLAQHLAAGVRLCLSEAALAGAKVSCHKQCFPA